MGNCRAASPRGGGDKVVLGSSAGNGVELGKISAACPAPLASHPANKQSFRASVDLRIEKWAACWLVDGAWQQARMA